MESKTQSLSQPPILTKYNSVTIENLAVINRIYDLIDNEDYELGDIAILSSGNNRLKG